MRTRPLCRSRRSIGSPSPVEVPAPPPPPVVEAPTVSIVPTEEEWLLWKPYIPPLPEGLYGQGEEAAVYPAGRDGRGYCQCWGGRETHGAAYGQWHECPDDVPL